MTILCTKDSYYIQDKITGCWMHRSPLKCIVNPILRKIQFWTDWPYVISSETSFDDEGQPHFIRYTFERKKLLTAEEYLQLKDDLRT